MTDILLDETFDLLIAGGDLVTGESTEQHQELLLLTQKGDWKEDTTVGVGVKQYLKDEDSFTLLGTVKKEFERDGMKVLKVGKQDGKLIANAVYN